METNGTPCFWGKETPYYGHIEDIKFIFNEIDYEFVLEGGNIVKACSLQTGGLCMVDYIEMEDGSIYTLNEETIIKYSNHDAFKKEFEDGEVDFWVLEKQGLVKVVKDISSFPRRGEYFTKKEAFNAMQNGKKVQNHDWLEDQEDKSLFYRMMVDGLIVDQDGYAVSDWDALADNIRCWKIVEDSDMPSDEMSKSTIKFLKEEIAEMEKDGMANNNAVERFNRKIESLQSSKHMSMEVYMGSLRDDIDAIKDQPENGCCDAVEIKVLENVLGIMNAHFGDYDTFCAENKHMAEFLESLGYTQAQISDIAMCGWKPINLIRRKSQLQELNTLSLYKISVRELSEDVIAMLDGKSDYVYTGLGRGSMIFNLNTLQNILEESECCDNCGTPKSHYVMTQCPSCGYIGPKSSCQEFKGLVEKVTSNGCKGLLLTKGSSK